MTLPIDPTSASALEVRGLRLALVDTADVTAFEAWIRADMRGFHGNELSPERVAEFVAGVADRRTTAVLDEDAVVATASSWLTELTIPSATAATIQAWAISSVTVAPTHRRRGIARALLEAELRTASAARAPLAILTVSESSIYGRFGFAPGAFATSLVVESKRVRWTGPEPSGVVRFMTPGECRELLPELHERVRLQSPGQIEVWGMRWDEFMGLVADDSRGRAKQLRAVRYTDAAGQARGLALYRVTGGEEDFTKHTLTVDYLATETPDAYAALWRYLLEVDLVSELRADLRSVDEPLLWQVNDHRAVTVERQDHLWLRILDVEATLEARGYAADARLVLEVTDDLGFAPGRFAVDIAGGVATVTPTDAAATLAMTVNELSALYLGGVAATTLVAAGRISELTPGAAADLDAAFRSPRVPWLSVWF
jgi:predicted acetyltransferase